MTRLPLVLILTVLSSTGTPGQSVTWSTRWDTSNLLKANHTQSMEADASGNVWVAEYDGGNPGVHVFNGTFWSHLDTSNSDLENNRVVLIGSDPEGGVWFATGDELGNGYEHLNDNYWEYVDTSQFGGHVQGLAMAFTDDKVWMAGWEGLLLFDRDSTWLRYDQGNSPLPEGPMDCLLVDRDNNLWVGTRGYGLHRFDGTSWQAWTTTNSDLPSNQVSSLAQTPDGTIWIGIYFGSGFHAVVEFDGDSTFTYHHPFGNPDCDIYYEAMAVDRQGRLYVAVNGCGLWRYDNGTWEDITPPDAVYLTSAIRGCLVIDKEDRVWYSLSFEGIYVSDPIPMSTGMLSQDDPLSLHPNPTTGPLTIHHGSLPMDRYRITIANALGQAVQPNGGNSSPFQIDLSNQPAGLYIITLTNGEQQWTGKVVKL